MSEGCQLVRSRQVHLVRYSACVLFIIDMLGRLKMPAGMAQNTGTESPPGSSSNQLSPASSVFSCSMHSYGGFNSRFSLSCCLYRQDTSSY